MNGLSLAMLAAPREGGGGGLVLLIQLGLFAAIFYFILIRPSRQAQKKHEAMLKALAKGDRVITEGGIIGEVIHIKENEVTVKTADNTRLLVHRSKIGRVLRDEAGRPTEG